MTINKIMGSRKELPSRSGRRGTQAATAAPAPSLVTSATATVKKEDDYNYDTDEGEGGGIKHNTAVKQEIDVKQEEMNEETDEEADGEGDETNLVSPDSTKRTGRSTPKRKAAPKRFEVDEEANERRDDDSDYEEENPKKKVKKSARKTKKRKEISPEELTASEEIDRLLDEANREFYAFTDDWGERQLDPNDTLPVAKKKLGSIQLLQLIRTKMCSRCKKKLGM